MDRLIKTLNTLRARYEDLKENSPYEINKLTSYKLRITLYENKIKKLKENNKMTEFAKGVNVKSVETKYGEIIKVGINFEEFGENAINDRGYINFDILKGKDSGKYYAAINNYKKGTSQTDAQEDIEEIPF